MCFVTKKRINKELVQIIKESEYDTRQHKNSAYMFGRNIKTIVICLELQKKLCCKRIITHGTFYNIAQSYLLLERVNRLNDSELLFEILNELENRVFL